ncbi:rRNA-processing protein bfr2 [Metarhizium rileyi]|uniref:Protein BFR2 n=1 Tax=Metarhizium rileyi (strain RCEF 4871) TaxID=1649241 RepID=A0A5C6GGI7_METRR|nr:rRNA-processing protein bfr2 [Metarhizium rileyi]
MTRGKSRVKQFQDPDEVITRDYDPEANAPDHANGSGSGSEGSEDENLGTEHYVSVGKSKLRNKANVSLGPEYRGSRVSRSTLDDLSEDDEKAKESEDDNDDDSFDDPDVANLEADEAEAGDSEIYSDDALGESDVERFKDYSFRGSAKPAKSGGKAQRATAADFMSDDGEGSESDEYDEQTDDGLDALVEGGDDSEEGDDVDEEEESEEEDGGDEDEDQQEEESAKRLAARPYLSGLSNRPDVDKGVAIQKQRKIYDGLLNLRIRLQKALVAANSFPTIKKEVDTESEPYEAAEEAAIKLLNTISSLRENIGAPTRSGEKRKRALAVSMSNEDIWEQLQGEDKDATGFREERLEKWSKKVDSVNMTRPNRLGGKSMSLIGALREQLIVPNSRLIKRTRVPRSCAPAQLAKQVATDEYVYDDADFYQLLLKELVDQRTVEGTADHAAAVPTVMVTATKEAKMRKQVDRKASKGRKMRFTAAIDRFFGTLFGQKLELNEDESDDEEMDMNVEEEELRLFRK